MEVLICPIITEKMTAISEKLNRYGFIVHKKANKIQIKKAVEQMYGVTVDSVNTRNYSGKIKRRNTKTGASIGRSNACKKAIVSLTKGNSIDLFSSV